MKPFRRPLAGVTAIIAMGLVPVVVPATADAKPASSERTVSLGDRTLRLGSKGADVKELQQLLDQVGIEVKKDGVFGSTTKKAVQRFQRAADLEASGTVGDKTVAALRNAAAAGAADYDSGGAQFGTRRATKLGERLPLRTGMQGADVEGLQRMLRTVGQKVTVDGEFGRSTSSAVQKFEREITRPVDGAVDATDLEALRQTADPSDTTEAPPTKLAPGDRAKLGPDGLAMAPENAPEAVKQIIAAGNAIAKKPYVYGGGHARFPADRGYDCSGSVSFALHGAGLLKSPLVSGDFPSWGSKGAGQWVTIYGNGGHVYMVVAGLRFDTSGLKQDGSRWHKTSRPTSGFGVSHPKGL